MQLHSLQHLYSTCPILELGITHSILSENIWQCPPWIPHNLFANSRIPQSERLGGAGHGMLLTQTGSVTDASVRVLFGVFVGGVIGGLEVGLSVGLKLGGEVSFLVGLNMGA